MSIFSADEIKNYLITKGINTNVADSMQTYTLGVETLIGGNFSGRNASIVTALDNRAAEYLAGLRVYENTPAIWDTLYTGQPQPVDFNDFMRTMEAFVKQNTVYMRHFAGLEY
jgi:hypothetical protein